MLSNSRLSGTDELKTLQFKRICPTQACTKPCRVVLGLLTFEILKSRKIVLTICSTDRDAAAEHHQAPLDPGASWHYRVGWLSP